MKKSIFVIVLVFALSVSGCQSEPDASEKTAKSVETTAADTIAEVDKNANMKEDEMPAEPVLTIDLDINNAETVILSDSTFGPYVLDIHQNDAFVKELMDKLNGEYVFVERAYDGAPRSGGGPSVIKFHDKDDQFLSGIRFGRQLPEDSWLMVVRSENAWDKYQAEDGTIDIDELWNYFKENGTPIEGARGLDIMIGKDETAVSTEE